MNYLEISTDLPTWFLDIVHDLLTLVALLTRRQVYITGPLNPATAEHYHEQTA